MTKKKIKLFDSNLDFFFLFIVASIQFFIINKVVGNHVIKKWLEFRAYYSTVIKIFKKQ